MSHLDRARPAVSVTLAVVLTTTLAGVARAADDAAPGATAFTNVNVISMLDEAGPVPGTVVVRAGKIVSVGAEAPPADAVVIDGGGGFLIPGLAEMHAHVPEDVDYRNDVLFLWVAGGITVARGMLGHPSHLPLVDELEAHEVLGPRLYTSGPTFSGSSVAGPASAASRVRTQKRAGYHFLKIHPGLSWDEFEILAMTARDVGITFSGHITERVGLWNSLEAGQAAVDHLDGYMNVLVPDIGSHRQEAASFFGIDLAPYADRDLIAEAVAKTKEYGAAVVPTETLIENFAYASRWREMTRRPQFAYVPPPLRLSYTNSLRGAARATDLRVAAEALSIRKALIGALHDAGVPVLLGSDSPQIFNVPGFSIHRELESMVAAGLTPFEALAAGTTAPAEFFETEEWGAIAPGRAADLVLLRESPLDDIANTRTVEGVMVRGRWQGRAELDAGLEAIERKYR